MGGHDCRLPSVKRLGILTAGGDCPGLNAVIRAIVKSATRLAAPIQVIGLLDGYLGLVENRSQSLTDEAVSGLLIRGGTILGTSNRDNPFRFASVKDPKPRDR